MMKRFKTVLAAASAAALLALSGCGTSVGASNAPVVASDSDVTIRLSWWGGDVRIKATEEAVRGFEEEHPNIHVETEYSDWTGYWDKLAVQSAGGNAPDVMQMDDLYLKFYASMNALLDLDQAEDKGYLSYDAIDENVLAMGRVDGRQYALANTITPYGVIINVDLVKRLGLTMPDTSDWTWSEFEDFAKQAVQASDGEISGALAPNNAFALQLWARQHGESLFDGNAVSVTPEVLAEFLDMPAQWASNGIEGSAERWSENVTATMNDSDFATNKQLMLITTSTMITPYATAAGGAEMELAPLPQVRAGAKTGYLKSGMFWTVSSSSQHPAEAAMLVDYLTNDRNAGRILGTERGLPSNNDIREMLKESSSGTDRQVLEFTDSKPLTDTLADAPEPTPNGASDLDKLIVRYQQDVVFGKRKSLDAAKAMIAELQESIDFNS